MKPVRMEVRLRNNVLWHAIFDRWRTVAEFCREVVLDQGAVGELLNLTTTPYGSRGLTPTADKLCRVFQMVVEDLFPARLYALTQTRTVVEAELPALPMGREALSIAAPGEASDAAMEREKREKITRVLAVLGTRERYVIESRFGLNGRAERTLEEIGEELRLSRPRIQQIKAEALRKLRHPSRSKKLRDFVE